MSGTESIFEPLNQTLETQIRNKIMKTTNKIQRANLSYGLQLLSFSKSSGIDRGRKTVCGICGGTPAECLC